MKLIGFCGPAGAGKTTCAKLLGGSILSFASPLKRCVGDLFKFSYEQLYGNLKEVVDGRYGVSPRLVMQRFGTEFVRSTVPDLWETLMREKLIHRIEKGYNFILIDDCRFPTEQKLIEDMGGVICEITRPGYEYSSHASEQGVEAGFGIYNDGTIEELRAKLLFLSPDDWTDL
jgi:hypothetical protein